MIFLFLLHDAIVSGAIYALIGITLVVTFATTRVIWVAQGDLVAFGALTFATLEQGRPPQIAILLIALSLGAAVVECVQTWSELTAKRWIVIGLRDVVLPGFLLLLAETTANLGWGSYYNAALSVLLVAPLSPLIYRLAFQPLRRSSILVLLIAAIGVHLSLVGLGLYFFGPEGLRPSPLVDFVLPAGPLVIQGQSIAIFLVALMSMFVLWAVFKWSALGHALRASADNRLGAQIVGISLGFTGRLAFGIAGVIGAVSGVVMSSTTTMYYDSGFMIGLKGFIAAIIGAMTSYPITAIAAFGVGMVESWASFEVSAYKESVVFSLLIPFLLWYSLRGDAVEDAQE